VRGSAEQISERTNEREIVYESGKTNRGTAKRTSPGMEGREMLSLASTRKGYEGDDETLWNLRSTFCGMGKFNGMSRGEKGGNIATWYWQNRLFEPYTRPRKKAAKVGENGLRRLERGKR